VPNDGAVDWGKSVPDSIIPISDEQAKLGQEIVKMLRGAGSFLDKALGSTPQDLIAYLGGDWLRVRCVENLVKLFERARQRLADWHVSEPRPAALSIALPILQGAADEDREELADLWARLLANATDPNMNNVRHSFIAAVKNMDPQDAVVLRFVAENRLTVIRYRERAQENSSTHIGALANNLKRRIDEIHLSLEHLKEMGLLVGMSRPDGGADYHLTLINREFMRACYPEITPNEV
jgi:hypothetical protein